MSDLGMQERVQWNSHGLAPAVVLDAATGELLCLAWMNAESLGKTLETKSTWFWSRSRQELWNKGATSGNTQAVVSVELDCDSDAICLRVIPDGPACHNNTRSCWTGPSGGALVLLDDTLASRADEMPEGSYTTKLLGDENLRYKKLGEEMAELMHALHGDDKAHVAEEAADLLYHVAVALRARGIGMHAVVGELLKRHS